jgi:hypothetical protein
LIQQETIPDSPVMFGGIKGIIETQLEGQTSAVWKRVTVRAESAPVISRTQPLTLNELDEQRSKLKNQVSFQLNQQSDSDSLIIWGDRDRITRVSEGWIVREPGSNSWHATGIGVPVGIRGDFDIAVELDVLKLEPANARSESTVLLHAAFDTVRPLAIEIKFSQSDGPQRDLEIQLNTQGRDRGIRYEELKHQQTDDVSQFRIARRGHTAYLIYRGAKDTPPQIYGRVDVGEGNISPNSLRTLVHTADPDRETIVRFKSITIHAEEFK